MHASLAVEGHGVVLVAGHDLYLEGQLLFLDDGTLLGVEERHSLLAEDDELVVRDVQVAELEDVYFDDRHLFLVVYDDEMSRTAQDVDGVGGPVYVEVAEVVARVTHQHLAGQFVAMVVGVHHDFAVRAARHHVGRCVVREGDVGDAALVLVPDILVLAGDSQGLIDGGGVDVAVIAGGEEAGGVCQHVGNLVVVGLMLCDGCLSERSCQTEVAEGVGNALRQLCLATLLLGDGTLALCNLRGFQSPLLSYQGVLSFFFGVLPRLFSIAAHLFGHLGLLLCGHALLLTDAPLRVGNLLHLGIHALHDGRALLLLGELLYTFLQGTVLVFQLLI